MLNRQVSRELAILLKNKNPNFQIKMYSISIYNDDIPLYMYIYISNNFRNVF